MPEMIRILCEGFATVLFTLICTRFLCKNMKKRDFRFVPWLPYPELKEELFITVAEMRSSGNIRNALDSLDKRIGSAWLSEVVRALETVENSADTTALWTSLSMKFKELQRLNLKAQANTVPRKVKKLSMALMMCFLLIYIAVIGQVLMNSLGGIM